MDPKPNRKSRHRRLRLSRHATLRLAQRNIPPDAVVLVVRHGRRWRSRGAWSYRLDRRALLAADAAGLDLRRYEGVHVVVGDDGTVITSWRDRTGRRIRR